MKDREQTTAFADELDKLCERFRDEFDLTYAQAVGVLNMKAWLLNQEASEQSDEAEQGGNYNP